LPPNWSSTATPINDGVGWESGPCESFLCTAFVHPVCPAVPHWSVSRLLDFGATQFKRRASSSECSQVGLPERIDHRPIGIRFAIAERPGLSIGDCAYIDRLGAKARCLVAEIKQRRRRAIVFRQFEQSGAPHCSDTDPTVSWRRHCYWSGRHSRGRRRWRRWRWRWRSLYAGKQQSWQQHHGNFPVHPHPRRKRFAFAPAFRRFAATVRLEVNNHANCKPPN
jgi:hypothetical protein